MKLPGLKESDGKVFSEIPAGKYPVRIQGIEVKQSKETAKYPGADYLNFKLVVLEGDNVPEEAVGRILFSMAMLPCEGMEPENQTKCVARIKSMCNAFQVPVESDDFDYADLKDQEAMALVTVTTYEGKAKNEIKDFLKKV